MSENRDFTALTIEHATYVAEDGTALCLKHRQSAQYAGQMMQVRGKAFEIGLILGGTYDPIDCAPCIVEYEEHQDDAWLARPLAPAELI